MGKASGIGRDFSLSVLIALSASAPTPASVTMDHDLDLPPRLTALLASLPWEYGPSMESMVSSQTSNWHDLHTAEILQCRDKGVLWALTERLGDDTVVMTVPPRHPSRVEAADRAADDEGWGTSRYAGAEDSLPLLDGYGTAGHQPVRVRDKAAFILDRLLLSHAVDVGRMTVTTVSGELRFHSHPYDAERLAHWLEQNGGVLEWTGIQWYPSGRIVRRPGFVVQQGQGGSEMLNPGSDLEQQGSLRRSNASVSAESELSLPLEVTAALASLPWEGEIPYMNMTRDTQWWHDENADFILTCAEKEVLWALASRLRDETVVMTVPPRHPSAATRRRAVRQEALESAPLLAGYFTPTDQPVRVRDKAEFLIQRLLRVPPPEYGASFERVADHRDDYDLRIDPDAFERWLADHWDALQPLQYRDFSLFWVRGMDQEVNSTPASEDHSSASR